jgi:hypothetical protein
MNTDFVVTSTYYFILLKTTFDHFSNFLAVFFTPLLIVPPDFSRLDSHNIMRTLHGEDVAPKKG